MNLPGVDWLKTITFVGGLFVYAVLGCMFVRWVFTGSVKVPRERPFARAPKLWWYPSIKGFAFSPEPKGHTQVSSLWGLDRHLWRPGDYVQFAEFPGALEPLVLRVLNPIDSHRYRCQEVQALAGIAELPRS